jgi:hypothetical protein
MITGRGEEGRYKGPPDHAAGDSFGDPAGEKPPRNGVYCGAEKGKEQDESKIEFHFNLSSS